MIQKLLQSDTPKANAELCFGDFDDSFRQYENSSIAILPVPYDKSSTYNKGADKGPEALLRASEQLENYDIETESEVHRKGIVTLNPLVVDQIPEVLVSKVKEVVDSLYSDGKFPVVIGGEHSVSIGAAFAAAEAFEDISVLQIDAHGDTRESYHGSTCNHACVMARIREVCPITQVGIRAIDKSEVDSMDLSRVFFAKDIVPAKDPEVWQTKVDKLLSKNVYVTIDLDAFDASIMPSTGTPEPGGMDWYQVTSLLKRVAENHNVIGFDVVELLPRKENPAPDFLAAKLTQQFLSYIFSKS